MYLISSEIIQQTLHYIARCQVPPGCTTAEVISIVDGLRGLKEFQPIGDDASKKA